MKKIISILLICVLVIFTGGCGETKTSGEPVDNENTSNIIAEIKTEVRSNCTINYHYKKNDNDYYLFVEDENFSNDNYSVASFISQSNIKEVKNNNFCLYLDGKFIDVFDNQIILKNGDSFNYHIRNRKELVYSACNGFDIESSLNVFGGELHPGDTVNLSHLKLSDSIKNILIKPEYQIYFYNYIDANEIYSHMQELLLCDYCVSLTAISKEDNIKDVAFTVFYNNQNFNATIKIPEQRIIAEERWIDISYFKNIFFEIRNKSIKLEKTKIFESETANYGLLKASFGDQNLYGRFLCDMTYYSKQFYFENIDGFDISQLDGQTLVFENVEGE